MTTTHVPTIDVLSPYTGELIRSLPVADRDAALAAVATAHATLTHPLPTDERARILHSVADLVASDDQLPRILAREAAKPILTAKQEVARAASTARIAAGEAERLCGEVVPLGATPGAGNHFAFTRRVPVGVVGAITPFNFPLNLVMHKVAPAVAAGCPVVLKPAEKTPLAALRLAEHFVAAGLEPDRLQVIVGHPEPIADVFCTDDRVALISFTGSPRIGRMLERKAAPKRVALELGNATPVIVCADADLDDATDKIISGAFGFAGQTCVSVQRVYIEEPVADEMTTRLVARARTLQTGDPLDETTDIGPVISAESRTKILELADDARNRGARQLTGGHIKDNLIAPIVLQDAPEDAQIECVEAFGPIISINAVSDFAEGVRRANATNYGLQAGVFTTNLNHALSAPELLDFAAVTINETPSFRADGMPYGGINESGNTHEGPAWAIREMTEERLTIVAPPANN